MAVTITAADDGIGSTSMRVVRLTTTATTDTYVCPYFRDIVGVVGNNESDKDGVGIAVAATGSSLGSQTITITVGTSGDVITLWICGRK